MTSLALQTALAIGVIFDLHMSGVALAAGERVTVYKFDGTRNCTDDSSIPVEEGLRELSALDIEVYDSGRGNFFRVAACCDCDAGTINYFEIGLDHLVKAEEKGFRECRAQECIKSRHR